MRLAILFRLILKNLLKMWTDLFLSIACIANSVSIFFIVRWLKRIDKPLNFTLDDVRRANNLQSFYERTFRS